METKDLKKLANLVMFITGVFVLKDIFNFLYSLKSIADIPIKSFIGQSVFILGLLCTFVCYNVILYNISRKGVFIRRNEKTFRYFGFVILFCGIVSSWFFPGDLISNPTDTFIDLMFKDDGPSGPRLLAFLGGTLIFISILFKVGIKMQEEQELTI